MLQQLLAVYEKTPIFRREYKEHFNAQNIHFNVFTLKRVKPVNTYIGTMPPPPFQISSTVNARTVFIVFDNL